jgi:prepilin-type N-terminal cleavage/methylation domain-containing protein
MSRKINKKGFTLIEVVLVLAIGALIFLLAFLAFQQVSRNRRDTQRRSDASRIIAEMQNYFADKRAFPGLSVANTDACAGGASGTFLDFLDKYLCENGNSEFKKPNGTGNYAVEGAISGTLEVDEIRHLTGVDCAGNVSSGTRVVVIGSEAGGQVCSELK